MAWLILMLPLIIGLMGMAIDFYRVVQLKYTLETRAQIAVVDAANEWTPTSAGGAGFTQEKVREVVDNTYSSLTAWQRQTSSPSALVCPKTNVLLAGQVPPSVSPCSAILTVKGLSTKSIEYSTAFCTDVRSAGVEAPRLYFYGVEKLSTTFLQVIGIPTLLIPVEAEALIRAGNC